MAHDALPLGPAFAWCDDAGQWFYSLRATAVPAEAIRVDRYAVDGKVVLHDSSGGAGRYIRGAEQVA